MSSKIFKGINVLVVDDQKIFREAVAFEFEILGCKTIKAEHGLDALQKFKNNKIDVVISDIRMPVCDGRKFLEELRKLAKIHPPFIFMTGFADLKPYEAYDCGADYFIGKPLKPNEIPLILTEILSPLEMRWSTNAPRGDVTFLPKIQLENIANEKKFQMGRSGFFVSFDLIPSLMTLENDAAVQFDFEFESGDVKSMAGIARIVWSREHEQDGLLPGCGLLIQSLNDSCRREIIKHVESSELVKTIPMGYPCNLGII